MTATVKELHPAIGTLIAVTCGGLTVHCVVSDVKVSYGKVRLQITPACGAGSEWIEMSRVVRVVTENWTTPGIAKGYALEAK